MLSSEEKRLLLLRMQDRPEWNIRLVVKCVAGLILLMGLQFIPEKVDTQSRPVNPVALGEQSTQGRPAQAAQDPHPTVTFADEDYLGPPPHVE